MNLSKILITIVALIAVGISTHMAISQELSYFEIMDNNEVGLTVAPTAKRGECLVDIDRNGWADIYILKYSGPGYSRLYSNTDGHFTDITAQTPVESIEDVDGVRTFNVVWADYDNDGDKDCSFGTNEAIYLLRNDNNHLTDVSEETGFVGHKPPGFITEWHFSVCGWADYDMDGDLDCLVYQYNNDNLYLFRNDNGTFTDVAEACGLYGTILSQDSFINPMVWTDWDMDGDPDISGRHNLFANEGGVFREVTEELGLAEVSWTNHKEFFDYDNDGDLDYMNITGRSEEGENQLWENRDGLYVNVSLEVGLSLVRDRFRGISTGDFDNDGDQDVFIQLNQNESMDVLLVNDLNEDGSRAFSNVAQYIGLTKMGDRIGGGFFDYNNDGFLDIYIPSAEHSHILYKNAADNGGNWIGFMLEGTKSNRDGVGAFITLYYANGIQLRYTKAGSGYLRQDNPWVHFGLGFETAVDSVVIRWQLGNTQTFRDLEINQYYNIKESEISSVEPVKLTFTKPASFHLEQNYPNPFNPVTQIDYNILDAGQVNLVVYDMMGKEVKALVNKNHESGSYHVTWDGRDNNGNLVASGVYVYKMKAGDEIESKKMVFIQ
ncbi:VCBS repeat-containing protein [candidate division KSB1 bacterium]|nr:VCBS repeat-containing protein [candidate division KSB1 bacterium]